VPTFTLTNVLAAEPAVCFDLARSVDAHALSMGASGEEAVTGVTSGLMGLGDTVTWRARHFRVVFHLTSRITEFDAPHRFVDEQVHGPFKVWRHEHLFEPYADGWTLMTDQVEHASPLGPLGAVVDRLVLENYMRELIERRNAWLTAHLCS
jgi:ligand-binding SRPBCC domain-containing protein